MKFISYINTYTAFCGICLSLIVFGTYFTFKYRLYDPRRLKKAGKLALGFSQGGISPLSSLSVALAGTLGVGNIVGVAVAVSLGGAGAVFWMLVSAVFGMACKFTEAYLSVLTRRTGEHGFFGGAPYYISDAFKSAVPGRIYAFLCILSSLTVGPVIQVNSAAASLYGTFSVPPAVTGVVFALLCGVIVFGGIKSVSSFTECAMPVFGALYLGFCLIAVSMRIDCVGEVITRIFTEAFDFSSAAGGVSGFLFSSAIRHGMAKGVLSHEGGCGTAGFSHAASASRSADGQGFLGIIEVFTDTVIFGGITALVILLSPAPVSIDAYSGIDLTIFAFSSFFGRAAGYIITGFIVFFAFAALICQAYYGCEAVYFLKPGNSCKRVYLLLYCFSAVIGAVIAPMIMWEISDLACFLLILVNCFCMIPASRKAVNTNK